MALPANVRGNQSRRFLTLLIVSLAIATELSFSGYALARWAHERSSPSYFATASVLFCLAALVQFRAGCCIFRGEAMPAGLSVGTCLRVLFVSGCAAYGVALALGPTAGIALVFAGCFAVLGSIILLPLAAKPQTLDQWRKLVEAKRPRRIGLAVYHALVLLVAAEALLRGYRLLDRSDLVRIATANEGGVGRQGSSDAMPARPEVLRVAIVEGLTAGGAHANASCADELAWSAAGLEVCRLNMADALPGAHSADWREELAQFHPDIVLGMIALERGLRPTVARPDCFDWRSLAAAQLLVGLFAVETAAATGQSLAAEIGAGGDSTAMDARRLAICRTPLDDAAKAQWRETFAQLDALVDGCSPLGVRVALVVVPDGFQVNRVLCDTLRRRAGYEARQLDLELPQRRLAAYAEERHVMLVDLLPYLRSSRNPVYHQGTGGWNQQGKQVAGRAISGWLQSQYGRLAATAQLSRGG